MTCPERSVTPTSSSLGDEWKGRAAAKSFCAS